MKKKYIACMNTDCKYYEKERVDTEKVHSNCKRWVSFKLAKEINSLTNCGYTSVDLYPEEPIIITEDIKVWVWDSDANYAGHRYLAMIEPRSCLQYYIWDGERKGLDYGYDHQKTSRYKYASFTDPRKPEPKTIILDGKEIELSAESYQNLKDHFNKEGN